MLYQILLVSSFVVLVFVCVHSCLTSSRGSRNAIISMYACALTFVVSGAYTARSSESPFWVLSLGILSFALLFPVLFINVKHYTALSLPQWRALRAFSLGVPLLLGLNGLVTEVLDPDAIAPAIFPPYVWTAYCFALFCVLAAVWRFTTTPRQRGSIALLAAVPCLIVGADLSYRLQGWLFFGCNPAVVTTLFCVALLSLLIVRRDQFTVRPVARSALIDQVRDILLVIDPNERIADCNRAAAGWLGESESELIGSKMSHWFSDDLSQLLSVDTDQHLVTSWVRNGQEHWFEVAAVDLLIDKQIHGKLVTLRDVSERRRVEMALAASRQELEQANSKLKRLANTDSLTGLSNRRFFIQRLRAEIERHSRSGLTLGLLMLDLDHFKRINDKYGHPVGDLVLQQAADCMQRTVRESDVVARVGGEEFAIIAVDAKDEGPFVLAGRLKEKLASLRVVTEDGEIVSFTASIGCVHFTGGVLDVDTLVALADKALYTSKREGRDRVTNRVYADYSQQAS